MTTPTLASTARGGHRVYRWQGREYPSVTAILNGGMPKPFLPRWAAKAAAEYAIGHLDHLRLLPAGQAIREVKQAPWATRDAAADLGDLIHAAVEAHVTGHPRPQLPSPAESYLAGFDRFLADHTPVLLAAEQTVYSRRYGYAGTFDALATLPTHRGWGLTLVDVKTGNRIYPEVCLQLAAYAAADFIGQPDTTTEQPLPTIAAGAVLAPAPRRLPAAPGPDRLGRARGVPGRPGGVPLHHRPGPHPAPPGQPGREVIAMAVLLGMLAGALLVFGAALASVWVQELRATRAERARGKR